MKASDAIALVLAEENVTYGFELIGGMITHLVDSINLLGKTKLISVHHEQGSAFAAGGIARATVNQQIGVALATSGPGATNLITGIADCWLDNVPCLFITGQVNTHELKGDAAIRQQGFQELDSVSLVESITKYAVRVDNAELLIEELRKAIKIAKEGRPGPVLLDIPMDIQRADIHFTNDTTEVKGLVSNNSSSIELDHEEIIQIRHDLLTAKRPLVLIGGGARTADITSLVGFLKIHRIPYVSSLKGSEFLHKTELNYGMIGAYGRRVANYAVQNCDLLLVLGSRLDVRQTGAKPELFAVNARIIQIDLDGAQLNNRVKTHYSVCCDLFEFIASLIQNDNDRAQVGDTDWVCRLNKIKQNTFIDEYSDQKISPFKLFRSMSAVLADKHAHIVADVGNNQMWAAHTIDLSSNQMIHHSGGLGSMGFAIPTAIGVYYATRKPVIVITGDGGAQLNIQELDILSRENIPILVMVLNNASLGMVRGFQEMYFDGRNSSTYFNGHTCDFVTIGKGYGLTSFAVSELEEFENVLEEFCSSEKPMLCELALLDSRECRPRLEFGNTLENQYPMLSIERV